jgi:hypothetical protein
MVRRSATWRSGKFSSVDNNVDADGVASLIQRFASAILGELTEALGQLVGQTSMPDYFMPGLESILKTAYDWNRIIKRDLLECYFEP